MPRGKPKPSDDIRNTVKRQLIELHYDALKDELKWDVYRYRALCHALSLTEYELGAIVRASISTTQRWLDGERIPAAVELHLTFIERAALRKPVDKPLFPSI